jgi:ADP-ribose pyrophosphatase
MRTPDGDRRAARLARYHALMAQRPAMFHNVPDAAYEILIEESDQMEVAEKAAARLRAQGLPEEYGDIGVVYEDPYILLVRDAVRFRTGATGPYVRILSADPGTNAAILAVTADGRVILLQHFRHGSRQWHWEIPRGFAHNGSDGATTAQHELIEEIGLTPRGLSLLGRIHADGGLDEIYLATVDLEEVPPMPRDSTEGIRAIKAVSVPELTGMIRTGEITDAYALAAVAFATAGGFLAPARNPESG